MCLQELCELPGENPLTNLWLIRFTSHLKCMVTNGDRMYCCHSKRNSLAKLSWKCSVYVLLETLCNGHTIHAPMSYHPCPVSYHLCLHVMLPAMGPLISDKQFAVMWTPGIFCDDYLRQLSVNYVASYCLLGQSEGGTEAIVLLDKFIPRPSHPNICRLQC